MPYGYGVIGQQDGERGAVEVAVLVDVEDYRLGTTASTSSIASIRNPLVGSVDDSVETDEAIRHGNAGDLLLRVV